MFKNKMKKFFQANKKKERGVALYLALLILSILLVIALVVMTLVVSQLRILRGIGDSVIAFYAADTGIERALNELYAGTLNNDGEQREGSVGQARYLVKYFRASVGSSDCPQPSNNSFCLKSVGTYQGVSRSIEVSR
jgi:Tfp pilus assembly protein PilX